MIRYIETLPLKCLHGDSGSGGAMEEPAKGTGFCPMHKAQLKAKLPWSPIVSNKHKDLE